MTAETDHQLGGGYVYQWECAVLLALNYLLDSPLKYNSQLYGLVTEFLGDIEAIHLEGKTNDDGNVDLEDINLLAGDRVVCIQVKTKQAEGQHWVPSDPLLTKALYRCYRNQALDQEKSPVRFVFLSNRGFNSDLAKLKQAIASGTVGKSSEADHVFRQVERYARKNYPEAPDLAIERFHRLLASLSLVQYLSVDAVEANIQARLQGIGVRDWRQAYEHLYTQFSKGAVRARGTRITRDELEASLGRFSLVEMAPQIPPPALFQLPRDIADFTGREREVADAVSYLRPATEAENTAVRIVAVAGMAGIGKSALAVHVAHHLLSCFQDTQLYVSLRRADGQPLDPFEMLGGFLNALGVEEPHIPREMSRRSALYRSRMMGKHALVVLDNAHDEMQVRPLLPGSPTCAVLITSRRALSALEGAEVLDLQRMSNGEALDLLRRTAGDKRVGSALEAARQIVRLCGLLPLAIRITGGKLRVKRHWSVKHYASRLEDERRRLEQLQLGDLSVRASFALSYRDLVDGEARLFRRLGVVAEPTFGPEIGANLLEAEADTAWEILERLVDLQLLEPVGEEQYRFHDLMHLFAQEQFSQEEPDEERRIVRSRADRWYLESSDVHFYTQARILEQYAHSTDPAADPDMLKFVIAVVQTRKDYRAYFFRSRPSAAWAEILWDSGFFKHPPPPHETQGGGVMLPRWDVQEYLESVADQVPDIVIKHVESVPRQGWYILRALRALCSIPSEEIKDSVPGIVEWLTDPQITQTAAEGVIDLIVKLVAEEYAAAAFALFRALTAPIPSSDARQAEGFTWGGEARSKLRSDWGEDQALSKGIALFREADIRQLVTILEEHLCTALQLEATARSLEGFESESWWRVAIEDTGQDLNHDYKDKLLRALRDAIEHWVQQDPEAVNPLLDRYLDERHQILRRLGLHILNRYPSRYRDYVITELGQTENLDDADIHHEFFMLLQRGYPHLPASDQETLTAAICSGPPLDRIEQYERGSRQDYITDSNEYVEYRRKKWIRDRLWMLKEHLVGEPAKLFNELTTDLGEPDHHPAFTSWGTGGFERVVSPASSQDLSRMSPEELLSFVREWQPDPGEQRGLERISFRGLAEEISGVVLANPEKYADQLVPLALYRAEFACALLDWSRKEEQASAVPWEISLSLCEDLLADKTVRTDMGREWDGNWVWARKSMADLLQMGLKNPNRAIPTEHLPRARNILLQLLDDPDPDLEGDRPPEGFATHNDPATIAINHVRSEALIALIEYARVYAQSARQVIQGREPEGPSPQRVEPIVRKALTQKLDREADPSWAVHSVYGRYLSLLYWLDQDWVESHIDQIFPKADDEASIWFYAAAWDSYVVFNRFHLGMIELLRPKYERATYNLGKGYVTQTHLQPARGLGIHVTWEYLLADYDLASPEGQQSLIAKFFSQAPPKERGTPAWLLWRMGEENPSEFATHWSRARSLWEWRTNQASMADHTTDFDREMQVFACLLLVAPPLENMTTLWPFLEGLLPHITRTVQMDSGWNTVEKYLASKVACSPARAIQLYRLMYEHLGQPKSYHPDESREIIEKAAAHLESRDETLSLIDLLGRWGDYTFKDIYDRYAR